MQTTIRQAIRFFCGLTFAAAVVTVHGGPIEIGVSIPPQKYLAERIGGSRVLVSVLLPPGRSPTTYEPTPRQLAGLGRARVFFRIGVPFEESVLPRLERIWPDLAIVDQARGLRRRALGGEPHGHGEENRDPHTWLSPRLLRIQAERIRAALLQVDPGGEPEYLAGWKRLDEDLANLDRRLQEQLLPLRGKTLLVFHPSWGYFADDYGLRQEAIEAEGKIPNPRHLARLIDQARREQIPAIFIQPQFDLAAARALAEEIGARVIELDPLAENCLAGLQKAADKISGALGQ